MLSSTYAQEFYCRACWKYIGPTGERVPYGSDNGDAIVWTECARCMEMRLEQEAREEERERREEERRRPRECELEGCGELFAPATQWQTYCCDEHRWKAHRALKKHRAA